MTGFGVDLLGFNADEFAAIMNPSSESEADPDAEVEGRQGQKLVCSATPHHTRARPTIRERPQALD